MNRSVIYKSQGKYAGWGEMIVSATFSPTGGIELFKYTLTPPVIPRETNESKPVALHEPAKATANAHYHRRIADWMGVGRS